MVTNQTKPKWPTSSRSVSLDFHFIKLTPNSLFNRFFDANDIESLIHDIVFDKAFYDNVSMEAPNPTTTMKLHRLFVDSKLSPYLRVCIKGLLTKLSANKDLCVVKGDLIFMIYVVETTASVGNHLNIDVVSKQNKNQMIRFKITEIVSLYHDV